MSAAPRAKPLNALTLAALPVGVAAWDDEIEHLASCLARDLSPTLRERLAVKHAALVRSRAWLAAKLAAETSNPEELSHE